MSVLCRVYLRNVRSVLHDFVIFSCIMCGEERDRQGDFSAFLSPTYHVALIENKCIVTIRRGTGDCFTFRISGRAFLSSKPTIGQSANFSEIC